MQLQLIHTITANLLAKSVVLAHAIVAQSAGAGATIDSKANAGEKQHERGRLWFVVINNLFRS
ncbi:hypothetical protein IGI04_012055 [Brassica rapa subsp. trilocularis]|uniref:VAN3-binding protein-like auxin canalisation domain-containing protein n=1 Tax=Brassica rapa subsp. trilocularis TaxID=1813537 RepID=A0ABQ7N6Y8_BRACM|nr:hypothetical protein IGI04_012055 [Brassica rapa subsp. trilocularis]